MEAESVDEIPVGPEWQYEPKWDGFRCLVFRDGKSIALQSKSGKPLTRYFPDVVATLRALDVTHFVHDGSGGAEESGSDEAAEMNQAGSVPLSASTSPAR